MPYADIATLNRLANAGGASRAALLEQARARAAQPAAQAVLLHDSFASAAHVAAAADAAALAGKPLHPLAGLPVTIKDLFDVAGEVTRAASVSRNDATPAAHDAPVVARLRAVGAALVGRTNMTEFAFSGVGINPHFGTPINPCDTEVARICGGSSSGSAASVALGIAVAALGSWRRWAATPAAPSAFRPRCAASPATSPPRGACRSPERFPCPIRSIRPAPWPGRSRTACWSTA